MPYHNYEQHLMGSAEIIPKGSFEVGSMQSFKLIYKAGKFGIDDQGGFMVGLRPHFDGSKLQQHDPKAEGYVTVESSKKIPIELKIEIRRSIRPLQKNLYIICKKFLKENDKIIIRIGDRRFGSPGVRLQTFCEEKFDFKILVDPFATQDFIPLPDGRHPEISIVPTIGKNWKLVAPSLRRPKEKFRISIKCEDKWGNPSNKVRMVFFLHSKEKIIGLPKKITFKKGQFSEIIHDLNIHKEGVYKIELKDDFKIYWQNFPIAKLSPGKDYLNPEIKIIIDDMVDNIEKINFNNFLQEWISKKINIDLKSLTDLKNISTANTSIRALAYQLYENNGVVKREQVKYFLKKIDQEERKILRNIGVKFGRYHIFLFKLFKPNAVSLRIALWKNFHQKYYSLKPPTFGLNFLKEKKDFSKDFMLLCGFEKFDNFFVRIDILERLFLKIIDLSKEKKSEIKLIPEMLNLLGCGKEDFLKLIKKMNYSSFSKNEDTYFKYIPSKSNKKQFSTKVVKKENPFSILKNIDFK